MGEILLIWQKKLIWLISYSVICKICGNPFNPSNLWQKNPPPQPCHCELLRSNQKEGETGRKIIKDNYNEYLYELKYFIQDTYMNLNALYVEKCAICQSEFISDSFNRFNDYPN